MYGAGCWVVNCSVWASTAFTPSWSVGILPATTSSQFLITPPKNQLKSQACLGSAPYWKVATQSSAVTGVSSDQIRLGSMLNVHTRLVESTLHLVAAPGTTSKFLLMRTSGSVIRSALAPARS